MWQNVAVFLMSYVIVTLSHELFKYLNNFLSYTSKPQKLLLSVIVICDNAVFFNINHFWKYILLINDHDLYFI